MMKVAIIGSGISGLTCAWLLNDLHDVEVFESEDKIGGHTATVDVNHKGKRYKVDTGFIVYNDWTYPNFIELLTRLKVKTQASNMSFSVMQKEPELEYSGSSFKSLFSQKRNLFNPHYWGMLLDITRFNREAIEDAEKDLISDEVSLAEYIDSKNLGQRFLDHYLIPMGSAIWSTSNKDMLNFPAKFFVTFFKNHGLLNIKNRPQWRVLCGGSSAYLEPLTESFKNKIHLNSRITSVVREDNLVILKFSDGSIKEYDEVIFACHSDQALRLLDQPTPAEQEILGAIVYKSNRVVLHTDTNILPKRKSAWASWNYFLRNDASEPPILSYNMNKLQSIDCDDTFVVTLNATELIDSNKIIAQFNYSHPQFSLASSYAQNRWAEINGKSRTWFCGAYWGSGFHEDGCLSGIRVAKSLGAKWSLL